MADRTVTRRADEFRRAADAEVPRAIAELERLVRIPSVSWPGFDPEHLATSAVEIVRLVEDIDVFDDVEIVQVPLAETGRLGHPAVVATRKARNGRPTVLLYAHHDVQPPGDAEEWTSGPYEATVRGDRLYGRGSADDKAGIVMHLAAIRALVDVRGTDFDLGIVLFIEGEEESGSPSLPELLRRHGERLESDVIVVADSANWDLETPALTVALRGAVVFNVRISTLDHAVHSGGFGGVLPDAMLVAIRLLSTLWNDDGSVAVDGLADHDGDTPEYDAARLRQEGGLLDGVDSIGHGEILSRMWFQPAITVTGIDAPSVRNASNTLVPSVRLRLSARVAPGQSSAAALEAIEAHLMANVPHGAHLSIEDLITGESILVDSGWAAVAALETMAEAWGRDPVEAGIGGSIPFVAQLVNRFPESQVLITAVADPDCRAHSPNESVHLPTLQKSIRAETLLLARLDGREK